ncbi:F-box domain [Trinorchestia longiramus]|nr:F-box domain [Trinorchestia longiramus]
MNLPPEIWEYILKGVTGWDAVNCSYVCQMWRNLLCRRIKDDCLRSMPEVYLRELMDLVVGGNADSISSISNTGGEDDEPPLETWPKIFELHLLTRRLDFVARKSLRGNEFLESFGDLVVIDDVCDGTTLLNFFTLPSLAFVATQQHENSNLEIALEGGQPSDVVNPNSLHSLSLPGRVYEMTSLCHHLNTRILVASVHSSNRLLFFCVRRNLQSVQVTELQAPALANLYCAATHHLSSISADNAGTLAVASSEATISLLRVAVDAVSEGSLELRVTQSTHVQFPCNISRFSFYQNTLKTVVKSGEVLVHHVRKRISSAPHQDSLATRGALTSRHGT